MRWMSYFTHGVVDVWCGQCLVWWMSFFTHGVVDVWCGGCLCGGCRTILFSSVYLYHYDRIDYDVDDDVIDDDDDDNDLTFPQCLLVPLHTPHSEQPLAEVFREIETMQ